VMLYGPAGTGKTIMCQAAAYEAKAELIIGIVTTLHYKNSSVMDLFESSS
jgi:ATP-dependent 26S proteasome regulatory subunit